MFGLFLVLGYESRCCEHGHVDAALVNLRSNPDSATWELGHVTQVLFKVLEPHFLTFKASLPGLCGTRRNVQWGWLDACHMAGTYSLRANILRPACSSAHFEPSAYNILTSIFTLKRSGQKFPEV